MRRSFQNRISFHLLAAKSHGYSKSVIIRFLQFRISRVGSISKVRYKLFLYFSWKVGLTLTVIYSCEHGFLYRGSTRWISWLSKIRKLPYLTDSVSYKSFCDRNNVLYQKKKSSPTMGHQCDSWSWGLYWWAAVNFTFLTHL